MQSERLREVAQRLDNGKTVSTYLASAEDFRCYLARTGGPSKLAEITREHIESYIGELLGKNSAATASVRYRSLQQFFKWGVEEEEIDHSPMERMRPPVIPEKPVGPARRTAPAAAEGLCWQELR